MDKVFTYENLIHAISGAFGGATAISVFYPLNTARTRIQCDDGGKSRGTLGTLMHIVRNDENGLRGLYQGWVASVASLGASNFVYFYTYNMLKTATLKLLQRWYKTNAALDDRGLPKFPPVPNLIVACIAGIVNVLMTTPLWVVSTRLAVQRKKRGKQTASGAGDGGESKDIPYTGIVDCLLRVGREEGIGALWNGVRPSLILVSNPVIHFVVYERLRGLMSNYTAKRNRAITSLEFFAMGAMAKAVATVLTYPLQLAQSKLRVLSRGAKDKKKKSYAAVAAGTEKHTSSSGGAASPEPAHLHNRLQSPTQFPKVPSSPAKEDGSAPALYAYSGTMDVITRVVRLYGVCGLYKGMDTKLLQTMLTAAWHFAMYEKTVGVVSSFLLPKKAK